jgi:hypothetical protein
LLSVPAVSRRRFRVSFLLAANHISVERFTKVGWMVSAAIYTKTFGPCLMLRAPHRDIHCKNVRWSNGLSACCSDATLAQMSRRFRSLVLARCAPPKALAASGPRSVYNRSLTISPPPSPSPEWVTDHLVPAERDGPWHRIVIGMMPTNQRAATQSWNRQPIATWQSAT